MEVNNLMSTFLEQITDYAKLGAGKRSPDVRVMPPAPLPQIQPPRRKRSRDKAEQSLALLVWILLTLVSRLGSPEELPAPGRVAAPKSEPAPAALSPAPAAPAPAAPLPRAPRPSSPPRALSRDNIHGPAHQKLPCAQCHKHDAEDGVSDFSGIGRACESCHKKDDEHGGKLGTRCAGCHAATHWKDVQPRHDVTPIALGGAHNRVACVTCHTGGRALRGQAALCITCHQRDDIHHQSLGPRCADCHSQNTFAGARFAHDTVGCTLRGVHRTLPCVDCHKGGNYVGLSPMCVSCHRDDAMRAAAAGVLPALHLMQTQCTSCHNPVTFRGARTVQSPPDSVCQ